MSPGSCRAGCATLAGPMNEECAMSKLQRRPEARRTALRCVGAALLITLLWAPPAPGHDGDGDRRPRHCTLTALDQLHACHAEVRDDFFTGRARCRNLDDAEDRDECQDEVQAAWREGNPLCREQFGARRELCQKVGEGRIDPGFEPEDFDDPRNPGNPNPFFPLQVGNRWVYEGGEETVTIEVLNKTKRIDEVDCIVVNDRVEVDGKPVEDTDDWFGTAKDGSVWYCGESSRDFETFEGDDPQEVELVSIDGSWKAERDGDLAGVLFPARPQVGQVYRQEWSAGNAEDAAEVVSTSYRFGADPDLDRHVPQDLAEPLCSAADCVVTREYSPLDPGSFEYKYYARGIGLFLEVNPRSGSSTELVECNVSPKCGSLP
jgi:hypothetical protein